MSARTLYDAAIVGAGPSGSAAATHLARAGYRVVLVDKARFPRDKPCAECLSPAATPLLAELDVLDELEEAHPAHRLGFRVYAPNGQAFQGDFAATRATDGRARFTTGLAIPRSQLDTVLLGAARSAGAEVHEGWRLAHLSREKVGQPWLLIPTEGEPIQARLLVAADGVHSTVANRLRLHVSGNMRKIALVAHMRGITELTDYVEMHVAGRRYVGIAPLEPRSQGDLCNVAMVVDEGRDGRQVAGRPQQFLLESLDSFPGLRGRLRHVCVSRRTLAISRLTVQARSLSGAGLLLVGDAAGYYDPFTGEGIYRALRGAQILGDIAGDALACGDVGATSLARYDRWYRANLQGKRLIERIIQSAVQVPPLMNHVASAMARHSGMADTIVAVTGDILPSSAVLRPSYLLRLLV